MTSYSQPRPLKSIFELHKQVKLREKAIQKIKAVLLPNDKILKIILIGSSVRGAFGKYEEPGFRGSLFSDFDFIVFVKDEYEIPNFLEREPNGRPFEEQDLNLAYRIKKFVDDQYDAEVFFVRESTMQNRQISAWAEQAGIPFGDKSQNPFIAVYES